MEFVTRNQKRKVEGNLNYVGSFNCRERKRINIIISIFCPFYSRILLDCLLSKHPNPCLDMSPIINDVEKIEIQKDQIIKVDKLY